MIDGRVHPGTLLHEPRHKGELARGAGTLRLEALPWQSGFEHRPLDQRISEGRDGPRDRLQKVRPPGGLELAEYAGGVCRQRTGVGHVRTRALAEGGAGDLAAGCIHGAEARRCDALLGADQHGAGGD